MDPSERDVGAAARPPTLTGRWAAAASLFLPLVLLGFFAAPQARAQTPEADSIRAELMLPVPDPPDFLPIFRPVPAMSAGSPTGYGAEWRDVFAGVAYQARARNVQGNDGSIAAGFGLGNARTLVGLEIAVISFSTLRSGWGRRVGVDFKLHRVFPGWVGVAVGWESAILRGRTDSLRSRYLAVSRWFQLRDTSAPFSAILLTGGIGNERFVQPEAWVEGREVGLFGSVGVRVLEPLSFVVDWSGQDLGVAASLAPFDTQWLVMSAGLVDLTGSAGDGTRLILSGSYLHRLGAD